jgi:hypothetical protein
VDADTPSVLVARADLPEGGFVMVHDRPASGGHHANTGNVDAVSEGSRRESDGRTGEGTGDGGTGETHSGHGHTHDIFGITEYLAPGHYGGVKVPLETVPAPGTYELVAMLHKDDGNEEFDGHGTDEHYSSDGSKLHVDADVKFVSRNGGSR